MSKTVKRLASQFKPKNYRLKFQPSIDQLTFQGEVTITGQKIGRPSQRLTFHNKGLKIKTASIHQIDKKTGKKQQIESVRINNHKKFDEIRLHANTLLYPGEYVITLTFSGQITNSMHGIYYAEYKNQDQPEKMIVTQFEPHSARLAFPCIDEPEAKATFDLCLIHPKDLTALSNMPQKSSSEAQDGEIQTVFETTPIMSTYLLAFALGHLHCVESKAKDGTILRTWASRAQPQKFLEYANAEAVKILEFFCEYFDTPFPLPKCDQLAIPDFEAGAMENWGLITYREIALLTDPDNRSITSEQYVSMVIGHEMSHQWFGNLVTMKWWDELWLNESFASLMEHIVLDNLYPDWTQWEMYTSTDVLSCSWRDIYKDVQPVHVQVNHPDEITTVFDPHIVYTKGGRILKMLREYIGEEAFKKGLKSYFKKFAYQNTIGKNLWDELEITSGKNVAHFMEPWISQSGMPKLTIEASENSVQLTQERFVLDKKNDSTLWPIPLFSNSGLPKDVLEYKNDSLKVKDPTTTIFNTTASAHLVVKYISKDTKKFIANEFSKQNLPPEARINILNDMLLLSRGGEESLTSALEIVKKSSDEPRDAVWSIMSRVIGTALNLTEGDEKTKKNIHAFQRNLTSSLYNRLGWKDEPTDSANTKGLRQTILSMSLHGENKDALQTALKKFKSVKSIEELESERRASITAAAVKAQQADIDKLINEYTETHNPDLQHSLAAGMCAVKDIPTAEQLIAKALGDKKQSGFVRNQDSFRWFAYFMRNYSTRPLIWKWLIDCWPRLEKDFSNGKSLEYFVSFAASPINTSDWQKEFTDFFMPKIDKIDIKRDIKVGISEIESKVAWRKREEDVLVQYFANLN